MTIRRNIAFRTCTGIAAAITLVLTAASCTPGETTTLTASVSGSPGATSSAATPTGTAAPAPAPAPAPLPAHVWVFGDEWTTNPPSEAQGSGCTPGASGLPDGVWFGFAQSWSTSQIAFDMACWWTGTEAEAQAAARGDEAYDFYITNDNTTIRLVSVAGDIPAKKAGWEDGIFTLSQVIADPAGSEPTNAPYPVWIYVNGGVVTELAVQYIP